MAQEVSTLEKLCLDKGMKMTGQRRVIARVLSEAEDHPDVEDLHRRASTIDARISIATVYRTVRLFEEANILSRHEFGDGRARYERAVALASGRLAIGGLEPADRRRLEQVVKDARANLSELDAG